MTETITNHAARVEYLRANPREHLRELLAWAEGEDQKRVRGLPSEWNQGHWAVDTHLWHSKYGTDVPTQIDPQILCGTTCCIAGKAVANLGGEFVFYADEADAYDVRMPNGRVSDIELAARRVLDLDWDNADLLFKGHNTIEDLRERVKYILNPEMHD